MDLLEDNDFARHIKGRAGSINRLIYRTDYRVIKFGINWVSVVQVDFGSMNDG